MMPATFESEVEAKDLCAKDVWLCLPNLYSPLFQRKLETLPVVTHPYIRHPLALASTICWTGLVYICYYMSQINLHAKKKYPQLKFIYKI